MIYMTELFVKNNVCNKKTDFGAEYKNNLWEFDIWSHWSIYQKTNKIVLIMKDSAEYVSTTRKTNIKELNAINGTNVTFVGAMPMKPSANLQHGFNNLWPCLRKASHIILALAKYPLLLKLNETCSDFNIRNHIGQDFIPIWRTEC